MPCGAPTITPSAHCSISTHLSSALDSKRPLGLYTLQGEGQAPWPSPWLSFSFSPAAPIFACISLGCANMHLSFPTHAVLSWFSALGCALPSAGNVLPAIPCLANFSSLPMPEPRLSQPSVLSHLGAVSPHCHRHLLSTCCEHFEAHFLVPGWRADAKFVFVDLS